MTPSQRKLAALSMDLKRVALSYQSHSRPTAARFATESLNKMRTIDPASVPNYIKKILDRLEEILGQVDKEKVAEDALMYSTILQNAALYGKDKGTPG